MSSTTISFVVMGNLLSFLKGAHHRLFPYYPFLYYTQLHSLSVPIALVPQTQRTPHATNATNAMNAIDTMNAIHAARNCTPAAIDILSV